MSPKRDAIGAELFFRKCIATADSLPEKIIRDKYVVYPEVISEVCPESKHITVKHLNNSLERDHQRVKKRLTTMRGAKNPTTGSKLLSGI